MRKFLRIIILLINIGFVILMLAVKAGSYIPPTLVWPVPLISIAFPAIVLGTFFFIIFWLFTAHKKYAFISSVAILLCASQIAGLYQPFELFETANCDYKIMTYNVKNFGYYDWRNNKTIRNNIFDVLNEEQPDILCFQEFIHDKQKKFNTTDTLQYILNTEKFYIHYSTCLPAGDCYGTITFSKFPIVGSGAILFDNTANSCIYTDIIIKTDTIRVYNLHLESYRLYDREIEHVNDITETTESFKKRKEYKLIYKKLKTAFLKRELQVQKVAQHIEKCPYETFVCGDFNDVSSSYAYTKICSSKHLTDSYIESGKHFGGTYVGKLPSFRIDYILHSDKIHTSNFYVRKEQLSDHYPSVCNFSVDGKE